MRRWRRPDFKRLLVGQHIVNGVGVGVIAVAFAASTILGFVAGQPATLGAISASISDLPAASSRPRPGGDSTKWRRC